MLRPRRAVARGRPHLARRRPQRAAGLWAPGRKEFGDEGGAHVHFAFAAGPGSLDALARRLRAAGVAVDGPLEHAGGDRSVYAQDPEGNVVEAWDHFDRDRTVASLGDAA